MKEDYEPVELADDTPEPKDEGIYFLYSPCIAPNLIPIYHISEGWELIGETVTWPELIKGRNMKEKITIQSLAAHDAQIRAENRQIFFKDTEIIAFAKAMLEELERYGLFDYKAENGADCYENAFCDKENGQYGFNAIEAGITAVNKLRKTPRKEQEQ